MTKIQKPVQSVKNDDLQKRWSKQQMLKTMIRKSSRPSIESQLNQRQDYLENNSLIKDSASNYNPFLKSNVSRREIT